MATLYTVCSVLDKTKCKERSLNERKATLHVPLNNKICSRLSFVFNLNIFFEKIKPSGNTSDTLAWFQSNNTRLNTSLQLTQNIPLKIVLRFSSRQMAAILCVEESVTTDMNTLSNREILFNCMSNAKLSSLIQTLNRILVF